MTNTNFFNETIRNILVNKNKNSDFISFFQDSDKFSGTSILRILPSGNYYIYTLKIEKENVQDVMSVIREIQEQWI